MKIMADGDFSSHTGIVWNGNVGMVEYGGGARGQLAIFYHKSVHNPQRSQQEGRPVFEDRVFVRVAPPGERLNIVDRPATRQDQQRWPQQWALFQQNKEQTPEGTPIELLYPEKPAVAATLRANGVMTIESCAELSGHAIDSIGMGAQSWVNAAQKYVSYANRGVAITQHRKDLEERDRKIRIQDQQIEELQNQISQLLASKASDSKQLSAIQEMLAGAMGHPKRPMSRKPQFGLIGEDEHVDFEEERINIRSQYVTEQPKVKVKRPAPKSIMQAPDPGYDIQQERINLSEAQSRRRKPKIDK
jgi:hypothetical protein